jgi:DNA modification methylase
MSLESVQDDPERMRYRVECGDSTQAASIFSAFWGKVALVVTSPPYASAIDYEAHAQSQDIDYRDASTTSYVDEYLPMLDAVWEQSWDLLVPGGVLAVNVASVLEDGSQIPLPQDLIAQVEGSSGRKWRFLRSIIWHKVTAGTSRAGVVIQNPYPGYWHPNLMTEYVLLFRKGGKRGSVRRQPGTPDAWDDVVWDIAPTPPRVIAHPAPFPEEIPHRLIRLYTSPNDIVFDPFLGSGTTVKAALDLGRRGLGIDREQKYVDLARQRISQPTLVRENQLTVQTVPVAEFQPPPPSIQRRHGAGRGARRAVSL